MHRQNISSRPTFELRMRVAHESATRLFVTGCHPGLPATLAIPPTLCETGRDPIEHLTGELSLT
jgi:hypothetical protein